MGVQVVYDGTGSGYRIRVEVHLFNIFQYRRSDLREHHQIDLLRFKGAVVGFAVQPFGVCGAGHRFHQRGPTAARPAFNQVELPDILKQTPDVVYHSIGGNSRAKQASDLWFRLVSTGCLVEDLSD